MNEQDQQPDEVRLLEWANVLLGHRWLIAALTILGGAIAYGLCKTAKPLYTAEAKLIANRDAETWSLMSLFGAKPGRGAGELLEVEHEVGRIPPQVGQGAGGGKQPFGRSGHLVADFAKEAGLDV